jgi:DNA invertase Pin-like site-specific DNA recombinase
MDLAFSYLRFSSANQADGDSIRRQTALRDAWVQKSGAVLDQSISLRDEGVSGFTGKHRGNPDRHALAAFLKLVEKGRVPRGSYLIVENLDRLTREHIRPALTLLLNLIEAGIRVVQLLPVEQVFDDQVEPMTLMMAIMELSRGHSESKLKSERIGAAWSQKRKLAASKIVTARVPAWIKHQEGKLILHPVKAETVRRVFRMAIDGQSLSVIARTLNFEKVALLGRTSIKGETVVWSASNVHRLLTSRATIGEYQPHRGRPGNRKPSGPPILDYYPAVVSPEEFHAAVSTVKTRKAIGRGQRGRLVNLFAGLLRDARTGGSLMVRHHVSRGSIILPSLATQGRGQKFITYPFQVFESAILSQLAEVKVEDVRPGSMVVNRAKLLADGPAWY